MLRLLLTIAVGLVVCARGQQLTRGLAGAQQLGVGLVGNIGRDIQREVAAVKQPLDETISFVGSSQCSHVKKIFGVAYDQIAPGEPDLSRLTLNFISRDLKVSYNLSSAAHLLQLRGKPEKLIIFMHGFIDDPTRTSFQTISDAFLKSGEYNILALDASSLIRWLYLRASTYVRFIGTRLGEVLAALVASGLDPASIHLIGHSLGSHIASFAGKTLASLAGARVGRISALDPAGPCFSRVEPELRLQQDDAQFVDVMHTDAGVYGLQTPCGHVDFYPNSGAQQPNCLLQTCSHSRAWELFAESVRSRGAFRAARCDSWEQFKQGQCTAQTSEMGYSCDPATRGLYFLRTAEDSPFGLGDDGLRYVNNEGVVRNLPAVGGIFG